MKTAPRRPGGGFDGTEWAGTRSDGRKQGRNSVDGCGEDRAQEIDDRSERRASHRAFVVRHQVVMWCGAVRSGDAGGSRRIVREGHSQKNPSNLRKLSGFRFPMLRKTN